MIRGIAWILTICVLAGSGAPGQSMKPWEGTRIVCQQKVEEISPADKEQILQLLQRYFELRGEVLGRTVHTKDISARMKALSDNEELVRQEIVRVRGRYNLARYHKVHVTKAENIAYVQFLEKAETNRETKSWKARIYEWTWIWYTDGMTEEENKMGYATEHRMVLSWEDGGCRILSNEYNDQGILTERYDLLEPGEDGNIHLHEPSETGSGVNAKGTIQYDGAQAVAYADQWAGHHFAAEDGKYGGNYNIDQYGYYGGADCVNFVSQCIAAGGMQWDYGRGKDNEDWFGTQWWFDEYPVYHYDNYEASPPSWRSSTRFIAYWRNHGYGAVRASSDTIFPGNPLVCTRIGHAVICVGYNSAGIPVVNGHSRDVYHVPYTLAGGDFVTFQFSTDKEGRQ